MKKLLAAILVCALTISCFSMFGIFRTDQPHITDPAEAFRQAVIEMQQSAPPCQADHQHLHLFLHLSYSVIPLFHQRKPRAHFTQIIICREAAPHLLPFTFYLLPAS